MNARERAAHERDKNTIVSSVHHGSGEGLPSARNAASSKGEMAHTVEFDAADF